MRLEDIAKVASEVKDKVAAMEPTALGFEHFTTDRPSVVIRIVEKSRGVQGAYWFESGLEATRHFNKLEADPDRTLVSWDRYVISHTPESHSDGRSANS